MVGIAEEKWLGSGDETGAVFEEVPPVGCQYTVATTSGKAKEGASGVTAPGEGEHEITPSHRRQERP